MLLSLSRKEASSSSTSSTPVSYTHLVAAALKNGTVLRYVAELPEDNGKGFALYQHKALSAYLQAVQPHTAADVYKRQAITN